LHIALALALALSCLFVMALFMGPPYVSAFIGVLPIAAHKFDYISDQDYSADFRRPLGAQLAGSGALIKFPLQPQQFDKMHNAYALVSARL